MATTRAATKALDWARVYSSLNLGKETIASLQAFRKRNEDARRALAQLKEQKTTLDIEHYRSTLKNQQVVDQAEKVLSGFKPVTYDVQEHVKAIEAFEAKAVEKAEETVTQIDAELKNLQATLTNIEQARSFDEITVDDVHAARPEIAKTIETMLQKGKWNVPGYKEKFGDLNLM